MNLANIIEVSCQANTDKACVVHGEARLTYREMWERSNQLARSLAEMGVEHGDRVGIFATNGFQFLEMFFAVIKLGAIFVSLNYRLREKEITYVLNDAEPKALILSERYVELLSSIRDDLPSVKEYIVLGQAPADMIEYEAALSAQSSEAYPIAPVEPDDCFCILYTSGTTGVPKGAMLTHGNIVNAATQAAEADEGEPPPPGITLVNVPMYHIAGVMAPMGMVRGGTVVILSRFDPALFLETVEKEEITTTYLVPTMLRAILDHPDFHKWDLSSLESIAYGAAQMPHNLLLRAMKELPVDYINTFGQTEGLGTITSLTPEDHQLVGTEEEIKKKIHRLTGVGQVIPGYEIRVVDESGRDVPSGEVGEFIARGPRVMGGYWKKPKATGETLRDGWLHTGDLVYMDEDGYVYLAGRKKDMINRAGENIYPVELEETLHRHPKIAESAVIGVPDDYWGEIVKAYIVLKPGETADSGEIIEFCRENLASYKKPEIVEFIDELPKNALGKVLKNVLREAVSK